MTRGMKKTLIAGAFTIIAAFIGLYGGTKISNNITIATNGQSITLNGKDIQEIINENEELKSNVEILNGDLEKKGSEIESLQGEMQGKEKDIQSLKTDIIKDISLVVDSVAAPNKYIGVAQDGELLLSTKALGEYFGKNTTWDSTTKTVYIGDKDEKVAKKVSLWDRPYADVDSLKAFINDKDEKMIGFYFYDDRKGHNVDGLYEDINYLVYSLDGKSKKISGDFCMDGGETAQVQYFVTNENDEMIYTSSILTEVAPLEHFEIDTTDILKIKISAKLRCSSWIDSGVEAKIQNLTILTTDY